MGVHSVQGLVPITNLESTIASGTSGGNGNVNGNGNGSGECLTLLFASDQCFSSSMYLFVRSNRMVMVWSSLNPEVLYVSAPFRKPA